MKRSPGLRVYPVILHLFLWFLLPVLACSNATREKKDTRNPETTTAPAKRSFGATDTLNIDRPSAVFFSADTSHQAAFKKQFGESDFDGMDHECFYQMKNARTSLQEHWPQIRIYEVKDTIVLRFLRSGGSATVFDLRGKKDLCGLYLFTPGKDPIPGDMMNIGTTLENYFLR